MFCILHYQGVHNYRLCKLSPLGELGELGELVGLSDKWVRSRRGWVQRPANLHLLQGQRPLPARVGPKVS